MKIMVDQIVIRRHWKLLRRSCRWYNILTLLLAYVNKILHKITTGYKSIPRRVLKNKTEGISSIFVCRLHRCVWIVYDLNWRKVCLTASSRTIRCNATSVTRNKLLLTQNLHWFRHEEHQFWRVCVWRKKNNNNFAFNLIKIYKEAQIRNF